MAGAPPGLQEGHSRSPVIQRVPGRGQTTTQVSRLPGSGVSLGPTALSLVSPQGDHFRPTFLLLWPPPGDRGWVPEFPVLCCWGLAAPPGLLRAGALLYLLIRAASSSSLLFPEKALYFSVFLNLSLASSKTLNNELVILILLSNSLCSWQIFSKDTMTRILRNSLRAELIELALNRKAGCSLLSSLPPSHPILHFLSPFPFFPYPSYFSDDYET